MASQTYREKLNTLLKTRRQESTVLVGLVLSTLLEEDPDIDRVDSPCVRLACSRGLDLHQRSFSISKSNITVHKHNMLQGKMHTRMPGDYFDDTHVFLLCVHQVHRLTVKVDHQCRYIILEERAPARNGF